MTIRVNGEDYEYYVVTLPNGYFAICENEFIEAPGLTEEEAITLLEKLLLEKISENLGV